MSLLNIILELLGGFILLLVGGNYLVDGGVAIAQRVHVSSLVIGLTIVAFGTSAPELLVSLDASIKGSSGIAIGNVIGSNTVNIGFILGLTALICPIAVKKKSIAADGLIMILASLLLMWFASTGDRISRLEGIIMLLGIITFTIVAIYYGRINNLDRADSDTADITKEKPMSVFKAVVYVILSCFALSYGADLLVDGATEIAHIMSISEKVIGLTIVAIGTSLPELAASLTAAVKKEMDISIGNIIGSNIFNILCVLGLSSSIKPIPMDFRFYMNDFMVMIAFSLLLMIFIMPWKYNIKQFVHTFSVKAFANYNNGTLGRISGLLLFVAYILYTIQLFYN